jgi:YesN/AraC family two-component response regulator
MSNLYNTKNEKILTTTSIVENTISTLFSTPNFYGIFFLEEANGQVVIDEQKIELQNHQILFYYPYQKLSIKGDLSGQLLQFHPDFFCIDIHAKNVGCQGVLFNNFFNDVLLTCEKHEYIALTEYYKRIKKELTEKRLGQLDMVSSHLKLLLVEAVRIKTEKLTEQNVNKDNIHHQLEKLLEDHFKTESSAEFYAKALDVSLTTFNRLCKKYFQNSFVTILNLKRIANAKNLLFLTNISIKDIAYKVGYNDPLYFSRVFKTHTTVSPKTFRIQLKSNRLV